MSQELPVSSFKWVENTSQFSIYFTGNYNEYSEENIFLNLMFNILKNNTTFTMIYPFYPERMEIEEINKLIAKLHDKKQYVIHIRNLKQTLNHR